MIYLSENNLVRFGMAIGVLLVLFIGSYVVMMVSLYQNAKFGKFLRSTKTMEKYEAWNEEGKKNWGL